MATKSNPENGPRVEKNVGGPVETTTLVERGTNHPAGAGVTVIKSWRKR